MSKIKVLAISGGTVCLLVIAGLGVYYWHSHKQTRNNLAINNPQSLGTSTDNDNLTATNAPNSIQSSGSSSQSQNNIDSGQVLPSQNNSQTQQIDPAALLDPKTFGQYDKYKTASTALFIDLKVGDGAQLVYGKKAAVLYKGWLTNGKLFDMSKPDSKGQLQPYGFTLGSHQVIAGWEQALNGMKTGGVRLLIIPPAAGYGAAGQGPIPGNAVLIFQVQLLAVQ